MCANTRYPDAIPLRSTHAPKIVEALTKFFTIFGFPRDLRSDQATNFKSKVFKEFLMEKGIRHHTSSAYHPQTNGVVERFHSTLKQIIRKYIDDSGNAWDRGIP